MFSRRESYPADKYLPSFLVLAKTVTDAFHVLFALDQAGDNVRVVTAYRPDADDGSRNCGAGG